MRKPCSRSCHLILVGSSVATRRATDRRLVVPVEPLHTRKDPSVSGSHLQLRLAVCCHLPRRATCVIFILAEPWGNGKNFYSCSFRPYHRCLLIFLSLLGLVFISFISSRYCGRLTEGSSFILLSLLVFLGAVGEPGDAGSTGPQGPAVSCPDNCRFFFSSSFYFVVPLIVHVTSEFCLNEQLKHMRWSHHSRARQHLPILLWR